MDRRKIGLIAAVAMGLLAVFLIRQYLEQQKTQITTASSKEKVNILVATKYIQRGQAIEPGMVSLREFPIDWAQPGALSSQEPAIGKIAFVDISKGEQILSNKLTTLQGSRVSSLSMRTPPGKRAITIPIDALSAVGGMVRPGDYVDVIGNFAFPQLIAGKQQMQIITVTLFQNVLVLAVGQEYGQETASLEDSKSSKESKAEKTISTITLALSPQEAELISFAQEQGKLRLALRPPLDTASQPLPIANWDTLLQYILSSQGQSPSSLYQQEPEQVEQSQAPEAPKIDIYRGAGKK